MKNAVLYEEVNDSLICKFSCNLDDAVVDLFQDELLNKIQEKHKTVIFDLEKVSYISYSFLKVAILAARETKAMHIEIIKAKPDIQEVFIKAKLGRIFKFSV